MVSELVCDHVDLKWRKLLRRARGVTCPSLTMAIPRLPSELVCRIISTARFLERQEKLHDSQLWKNVRWYVGNRDVQQVPPSWASSWFLELIRALMDPSVRTIHLRSSMAG